MSELRRYQITGVNSQTQQDVKIIVEAATSANAKAKAELDGVIVTRVQQAKDGNVASRILRGVGIEPMPAGHQAVLWGVVFCWGVAPLVFAALGMVSHILLKFAALFFGGVFLLPFAMFSAVQRKPELEYLRTQEKASKTARPRRAKTFDIIFATLVIATVLGMVGFVIWQTIMGKA